MRKIAKYTPSEEVYQSSKTLVFRAFSPENGSQPVILKILNKQSPAFYEIAQYHNEYSILQRLKDLDCTDCPIELEFHGRSPVLVVEDFGKSRSLQNFMQSGMMKIESFLQIAIQIVEALKQIHQKNVIHRDLKPSHILIQKDKGKIKIIDFGNATLLSEEHQDDHPNRFLEGTPAYLSPEQTGRINRVVDYRTDFYSLGICFYEALCGILPFQAENKMDWIHAHIAQEPLPLQQRNSKLPPMLSKIIMKLLSKESKDRYQSAYGLKFDLEKCLGEWEEKGEIQPFLLAERDVSHRFQFPSKLYGREEEKQKLLESLERVCGGNAEFLLIKGDSGVGKSNLVQEIRYSVFQKKGFFIAGKFEQFKRNIPYYALTQALKQLVQQILSESNSKIQHWKEKLQQALGDYGKMITDLIPQMEQLLGVQPLITLVSPLEFQNLFNSTFQNFITALATKERPLVLFLDDLQWADTSTLELIRLLTQLKHRYFLLLGAYRKSEVSEGHHLKLLLDELEQIDERKGRKTTLFQIGLEPLEQNHIAQLLQDSLRQSLEQVLPLAELILKRTHGFPFFVRQFLENLLQEKLVYFDSFKTAWVWDLNRIEEKNSAENVAGFMVKRLEQLSKETREILSLASCIGNSFDFHTLLKITKLSLKKAQKELLVTIEMGMIVPLRAAYPLLQSLGQKQGWEDIDSSQIQIQFRFLHDRVEQAAHSLLSPKKKEKIHYQIGELWHQQLLEKREEFPKELWSDLLFDITNQWNRAQNFLSTEQKVELVQLNKEAGKRAKDSTAYSDACQYFEQGIALCRESNSLLVSLYRELVECQYITQNYEYADELAQKALQQIQQQTQNQIQSQVEDQERVNIKPLEVALQEAQIHDIRMVAYINHSELSRGIDIGLECLGSLGIKFPDILTIGKVGQDAMILGERLKGKSPEELLNIPLLQDSLQKMQMKILMNLVPACYLAGKRELFGVAALKMLEISLDHGYTKESAYAYAAYGFFLSAVAKQYEPALQFGELALGLNQKHHNIGLETKINFIVGSFIQHWRKPVQESIPLLERACKLGKDTGDLLYAGYAMIQLSGLRIYQGDALDQIYEQSHQFSFFLKESNDIRVLDYLEVAQQFCQNLRGLTKNETTLNDDRFDEEQFLKSANPILQNAYYRIKAKIDFFFGHYQKALAKAEAAHQSIDANMGSAVTVEHYLYYGLILTALYSGASPEKQSQYLTKLQGIEDHLQLLSQHCSINCLHKLLLLQAEKARIKGQHQEAMDLYERSICEAKKNRFTQNEALANELAGKYYYERNLETVSKAYYQEAYYGYLKWSAFAKVRSLVEMHPQFFGYLHFKMKSGQKLPLPTTTASLGESGSLDIETIIKAARDISSEMNLEKLLKKTLQHIFKNVGAQRGFFILEKEGDLSVEVEAFNPEDILLCSTPLHERKEDLATGMVNYVFQTQESLVWSQEDRDSSFSNDSYILNQHPKSILLTPFDRGKARGVFYLENNLTTEAFTSDRLQMLEILAAQAAIALENAQLYYNLEKANQASEEYNRELTRIDEIKNEFLANTSHELRTPLQGMIGMSESFLENYSPLLDKEGKSQVSMIVSSGRRLSILINDIQDFSKLKKEDLKLAKTTIRLWDLVEVVISYLSLLAYDKGLLLSNQIDPQLSPVLADENRVHQIIYNLLANAIKFSESGEIKISAREQGEMLEISVSDQGIGVAKEDFESIFEAFQQGDMSSTRDYGGTGLGLSITKQLIELHGGEIGLESKIGKGTKFTFSLPISHDPIDTQDYLSGRIVAEEPIPPMGEELSPTEILPASVYPILVVDDEPFNLRVMTSFLSFQKRYSVYPVKSGAEALEWIAKNGKPTLMLLDVMMPKMSGFEVCEEVRRTYSKQELPIIFLTAKGRVEDRTKGLELGGNDYITKPFFRGEFFARVQNQLELALNSNRLKSLRKFSEQIGNLKDEDQMMESAFSFLCQNIRIQTGVLVYEKEILKKEGIEAEGITLEDLPEIRLGANEEAQMINSKLEEEDHWIYIHPQDLSGYQIYLKRKYNQGVFTIRDHEYSNNIVHSIKAIRKSLQGIVKDSDNIQVASDIRNNLDRVISIHSNPPYCLVTYEHRAQPVQVRMTLQKLKIYFSEVELLRVHRSYLVNPKKILKVIRKSSADYDLLTVRKDIKNIPIGRSYQAKLRKHHPSWFEK